MENWAKTGRHVKWEESEMRGVTVANFCVAENIFVDLQSTTL